MFNYWLYTYDNGLLAKEEWYVNGLQMTYSTYDYKYATDTVAIKSFSGNTYTGYGFIALKNGLQQERRLYYRQNNGLVHYSVSKYYYDANGDLTKVEKTYRSDSGTDTSTVYHMEYDNKKNPLYIKGHWDYQAKHNVVKSYYGNGDDMIESVYQYDNNNYPTKVVNNSSGGNSNWTAYEDRCR